MAELPKIVRERLRAGGAGEHPDANLLTAFAERTLTAPERTQVLEHLSRCAQCREVVALAQPETEPTPVVVKGNWWRSPAVHWAALTTAALIVLVAVANLPHPKTRGYVASAPATPAALAQPTEAVAPATFAAQAGTMPEKTVPEKKVAPIRPPHSSLTGQSKVSPELTKATPPATTADQSSSFYNRIPSVPAPAPAPALPRERAAGNMAPLTQGGPMQGKAVAAPGGAPISTPRAAASESVEVTAAPPVVWRQNALKAAGPKDGLIAKPASLGTRWSISSSGTVQQSFDGGRSWRQVPVAEGVVFRAVSVAGSDIWAGGSSSALFHSSDGGEHWTRVPVQSGEQALTGDIVRVDFSDPANGLVTTSTKEAWTTADAGATWKRQ